MSDGRAAEVATYLDRLAASDEVGAIDVLTGALDRGADPVEVLLDVVADAQRAIGERWEQGEWTVVQEHVATHISERAVAAVARHVPPPTPGPDALAVAVACLDGEWHGLPARLLAEVLARAGFAVTYLGESVPVDQLATHLHGAGPDVVAVSSSLPSRLPAAAHLVDVCRATDTPVLVGGPAFGPDGRWARAVGADGWAPDARAAVDLLRARSAGEEGVAGGAGVGGPGDALRPPGPDPAAREERLVLHRRRAELVAAAGRAAAGASGTDPDAATDATDTADTAETLAHLVDFLAAAVLVDDPDVLGRFVAWSTDAPTGLDAAGLAAALGALADLLREFPRALSVLRAVTPARSG